MIISAFLIFNSKKKYFKEIEIEMIEIDRDAEIERFLKSQDPRD